MTDLDRLHALAHAMGVHVRYTDGLGQKVEVGPDTLVAVCAALGAPIEHVDDAARALSSVQESQARRGIPLVSVAWDGELTLPVPAGAGSARVRLEDGSVLDPLDRASWSPLPPGYHELTVEVDGRAERTSVISAPRRAWNPGGRAHRWGFAAHLAALRSTRSRGVGDLTDLEQLCRWTAERGGDVVSVLPLLPTFNDPPAEPSPYSPVSRLFWSELVLDLPDATPAGPSPASLDLIRASRDVREALRGASRPDPASADPELRGYALFRGAQARLGRDWRRWPARARTGSLDAGDVDQDEASFHLLVQSMARRQLEDLGRRLDGLGVRLGLDLAVGVHPEGYDPWSRPHLFAAEMSVGAPPDPGFPSGQDWGFRPVLPDASTAEGHRYFAASLAHQASVAGLLRIDHVMALARLYWIPLGMDRADGTYVSYPADELFAVLCLESHRNECEIVGEDLGTVPPEIREGLARHGIHGMYLAQFGASSTSVAEPTATQVAMIGTHDTPTFVGWLDGRDIAERVRCGLLDPERADDERSARAEAVERLADAVDTSPNEPRAMLSALISWLGRSASPLVVLWLEDLWLEPDQVNLPGTSSSARSNWRRPMRRLLDDVLSDDAVTEHVRRLAQARRATELTSSESAPSSPS